MVLVGPYLPTCGKSKVIRGCLPIEVLPPQDSHLLQWRHSDKYLIFQLSGLLDSESPDNLVLDVSGVR